MATPALAETVVSCGGSEGHAFYFDSPLLQEKDTGWVEDKLTDGAVALVRNGDSFDILVKDAMGMLSATSQGAQVVVIDAYASFITVFVNYPSGSKELYTFDRERRQFTWSQHKFGVLFDKAHTMVGQCG